MTKEKTIHQNNLESFARKIYKFLNSLSPLIKNIAFMIRNNKYNQSNFQCLYSTNWRTVKYGTETVMYRAPQIWNLVPEKSKYASPFDIFQKKIRKWKGEKSPYRIDKAYIQHVDFIWTNCVRILWSSFTLSFILLICFLWGEGELAILVSTYAANVLQLILNKVNKVNK